MKQQTRKTATALAFISPWIIGFLAFSLIPLINSAYYSLCDYDALHGASFIGLENYRELFFHDMNFRKSLSNTLYMIFIGLPIVTVVTLFIAIILNDSQIRGLSVFRVVFFIPTLIPLVVSSILWIWILQPDSGLVNSIFRIFGLQGPGWFASPQWAKPAFILMMIWGAGRQIILLLAGLKDIPESLYEAASLDGANYAQKHIHISVPLLKPVILFNVITGLIATFQSFAESMIITDGGPDGATLFYSLYLYRNAFQYFKMGYASAMSCILLVISLAFVLILFRRSNREGY